MIKRDGIERRVLNILVTQKDTYDVLKEITKYAAQLQFEAAGEEAASAYDVLRKLSDSENNAGWESRHTGRTDELRTAMRVISDKYEEFLP